MRVALGYFSGALVALMLGLLAPYWFIKLVLFWSAVALGIVATGYLFSIHSLFRKRANGRIPRYIRWLLWPVTLGSSLYNRWRRHRDKGPAFHQLSDHLYVGSRLFQSDIETLKQEGIVAILDVTAEFNGLDWSEDEEHLHYLNIPVLDHRFPPAKELHRALNWLHNHIRQGRSVIVHCALGRGRSVFVSAAYLLACNPEQSVKGLLSDISATRRIARLNRSQKRQLNALKKTNHLHFGDPAALIINPVAGGGKWQRHKALIMQKLSQYYLLEVYKTTEQHSASELARQALKQGHTRLFAGGGDGTVNAVAATMVDSDATLGILPLGTANALSSVLLGQHSSLIPMDIACDVITRQYTQRIDTLNCNDETALLMVGLGFECSMIENADREAKDAEGQIAYLKGFWQAINANDSLELEYQLDDEAPFSEDTASVVIANAAPFSSILARGGGEPRFDDGLLDMTLIPAQEGVSGHIASLLELTFESMTETTLPGKTHHFTPKQVVIRAGQSINYVLDGEKRRASELTIRVCPRTLNVLVPHPEV
ncbi:Protein-serine/threonine phosphatase [Saliniradius amylolyticus]|uniref:Protein-serine/threonine phosphatase n=1 Tax=Saliniradius amylolyticus TaxID=2183582 RepID=A0A2S2E021_9ALTE|nr:diacylglycerol kinase family protein [Saliniradius amylolyticus]AWL10994.1 Protein-serine/threonine phosphatase [Saliniradius amylolyticus]